MTDDDLFRPLSAKVTTRCHYSSAGRELSGGRAWQGEHRRIAAARRRAEKDRQKDKHDDER